MNRFSKLAVEVLKENEAGIKIIAEGQDFQKHKILVRFKGDTDEDRAKADEVADALEFLNSSIVVKEIHTGTQGIKVTATIRDGASIPSTSPVKMFAQDMAIIISIFLAANVLNPSSADNGRRDYSRRQSVVPSGLSSSRIPLDFSSLRI